MVVWSLRGQSGLDHSTDVRIMEEVSNRLFFFTIYCKKIVSVVAGYSDEHKSSQALRRLEAGRDGGE